MGADGQMRNEFGIDLLKKFNLESPGIWIWGQQVCRTFVSRLEPNIKCEVLAAIVRGSAN